MSQESPIAASLEPVTSGVVTAPIAPGLRPARDTRTRPRKRSGAACRAGPDPIATFNVQPLPERPTIRILPGPPDRYVAVLPTPRHPGDSFSLTLKGEDRWGTPSDRCGRVLRLVAHELVEVGYEDRLLDASGILPKTVRIFRLPDQGRHRSAIEARAVATPPTAWKMPRGSGAPWRETKESPCPRLSFSGDMA